MKKQTLPNLSPFTTSRPKQSSDDSQFASFSASELYCPNCKKSMPVREKLLLTLPSGDLFDYACKRCGTSVGRKTT